MVFALCQGVFKRDGVGNVVSRHHFFDVAQHKIHQRAFDTAKHLADVGDDDVFNGRVFQYQAQCVGKVFQHHNGGGTAIDQLVFQFARRIQWVDVCHHITGL